MQIKKNQQRDMEHISIKHKKLTNRKLTYLRNLLKQWFSSKLRNVISLQKYHTKTFYIWVVDFYWYKTGFRTKLLPLCSLLTDIGSNFGFVSKELLFYCTILKMVTNVSSIRVMLSVSQPVKAAIDRFTSLHDIIWYYDMVG